MPSRIWSPHANSRGHERQRSARALPGAGGRGAGQHRRHHRLRFGQQHGHARRRWAVGNLSSGTLQFRLVDFLAGIPLGTVTSAGSAPASSTREPWAALKAAVLPALQRPPAVVAFSGGVDSSLVLAAATTAARANGLPDPVAVTMRFPAADSTFETPWQEPVITSLRLADWHRIELGDDLDLLGPLARKTLARSGGYWPPNAHSMAPIVRLAHGGSLITGVGGDDLLREWRWANRSRFLRQPSLPGYRALPTVVLGTMPMRARRAVIERRTSIEQLRWLTAAGAAQVRHAMAEHSNQPVRWPQFLSWVLRKRSSVAYQQALEAVAGGDGATVSSPLLDPGFAAALARAGGRLGFPNRGAAVAAIAGDRLPTATAARTTKATFHEVFWGPAAREFAAGWDGRGADPELVDVDALREEWSSPRPDFRSMWLLHRAWLASVTQ